MWLGTDGTISTLKFAAGDDFEMLASAGAISGEVAQASIGNKEAHRTFEILISMDKLANSKLATQLDVLTAKYN